MTLKWFHVLFITVSVLLAVGVAFWAVQHSQWLTAVGALAAASALVVYRQAFLRNASKIGLR